MVPRSQRWHDKGKPAERLGRKATGPSGSPGYRKSSFHCGRHPRGKSESVPVAIEMCSGCEARLPFPAPPRAFASSGRDHPLPRQAGFLANANYVHRDDLLRHRHDAADEQYVLRIRCRPTQRIRRSPLYELLADQSGHAGNREARRGKLSGLIPSLRVLDTT